MKARNGSVAHAVTWLVYSQLLSSIFLTERSHVTSNVVRPLGEKTSVIDTSFT